MKTKYTFNLKMNIINKTIVLSTLFFIMFQFNLSAKAHLNKNVFQDAQIQAFNVVNNPNSHTFQLFSHGRPGELLLNGKWCNAQQIATFLQPKIQNSTFKIQHLNVYGCEFAKGTKGLQAVAYLQKTLGVSISASTNITGKNGDWVLEVGKAKDVMAINNYNGNLQCNQGYKFSSTFTSMSATNATAATTILNASNANVGTFSITYSPGSEISAYAGTAVSNGVLPTSSTNNSFRATYLGNTSPLTWTETTHICNTSAAPIEYTLVRRFNGGPNVQNVSMNNSFTFNPSIITSAVMIDPVGGQSTISPTANTPVPIVSGVTSFNNVPATTGVMGSYYIQFTLTLAPGQCTDIVQSRTTPTGLVGGMLIEGISWDLSSSVTPTTSATTITNTCPNAYPNLNSLINNLPAGQSVVWYNNNTQTGLPYQTPTAADTGTYYPYFLDPTSNCLSNVGPAVTVTISACDSDGDGIPDSVDLDDDNDGILDAVESPSCFYTAAEAYVPLVYTGLANNNGTYVDLPFMHDGVSTTTANNNVLTTGTFAIGTAIYNVYYPIPVKLTSLSVYGVIGWAGGNSQLEASTDGNTWVSMMTSSISSSGSPLTFTANQNTANSYQYYRIKKVSGATAGAVNTYEVKAVIDTTGWIPSAHPKRTCNSDLDGDGIPNYLDLDSDGDGCPDAKEGGSTLSATNASGMPGGNSGTGFTGTTSTPVTVNITTTAVGSTPTTMGVPTAAIPPSIATIGQTIGYSQDKTLNACLDTDGDGVPDIIDLDDDNDGILDVNEMQKACDLPVNWTVKAYGGYNGYSSGSLTNYSIPSVSPIGAPIGTGTISGNNINAGPSQGSTTLNSYLTETGVTYTGSGDADRWAVEYDYIIPATGLYSVNMNGGVADAFQISKNSTFLYGDSYAGGTSGSPVTNVMFNKGDTLKLFNGEGSTCCTWFNATLSVPCNAYVDIDTDGDGIPNRLDLDSDGDGCPDAVEASVKSASGATFTNAPAGMGATTGTANSVAPSPYGANGFSDAMETATESGIYKYTYTYRLAIDSTKNACSDADGDGVADVFDLDDDNDGILNAVESPSCFYTAAQASVFKATGSDLSWDAGYPLSNATNGIVAPATDFTQLNPAAQSIVGKSIITLSDSLNLYEQISKIDVQMGGFGYAAGATGKLQGWDGMSWVDLSATSAIDVINTTKTFTNTLQPNGYFSKVRILGVSGTTNYDRMAEVTVTLNNYKPSLNPTPTCNSDTDGDGIPNYLDLDSDGDGCPDAIEGAAGLAASTLVTSTMPGGNSGGTYTGTSSSPVVKNLCNAAGCVGSTPTTMGVPTVVATGQAIGNSQNKLVQSANCPVCNAGTVAPAVTPTTASATCPATVNLTTLASTGSTPVGATKIWSTHNPPTSVSDTLTTAQASAVAVSGKYYTFFYDNVNACYSPADSVTVTVTPCLDSDGDGIPDYIDLDDDNDGILDTVECPLSFVNLDSNMFKMVHLTSPPQSVPYTGLFTNYTKDISSYFSLAPGSIVVQVINGLQSAGGNFTTDNVQTTTFLISGTVPVTAQASHGVALGANGKKDGIISNDGSVYNLVSSLNTSILTSVNSPSNNYYVQTTTSAAATATNNPAGNYTWQSQDTISSISFYSTNPGNNNFFLALKPTFPSGCPDTDGDGIPNYLDLDSDNDGCPDALEAGVTAQSGVTMTSGTSGTVGGVSLANSVANGPYSGNGFADVLQAVADTNTYKGTYTYSNAINASVNACVTPDTVISKPACPSCPITVCTVGDDIAVHTGATYTTCGAPTGFTQAGPDANGCYTYTPASPVSTTTVTTCQLICKNGVCDTTYVIIYPPVTPDTIVTPPAACPTCPVGPVCVVGDDIPAGSGTPTITTCGTPAGYTAAGPDASGCFTYTPTSSVSLTTPATSCIVICKNGVCDTTYITIPVPVTPDTVVTAPAKCPTCPVGPVCVVGDDIAVHAGATYTTCGTPAGYTAAGPDASGCFTYTPTATVSLTTPATSCIVICNNGVCDTTYITIPVPVTPDTVVTAPAACPTCPVGPVCVIGDDIPAGSGTPTITTCGLPAGYTAAGPDASGCFTYTPTATVSLTTPATTCIVICNNGVCDTTYITIPVPVTPDTIVTPPAKCPTCPVGPVCVIGDDIPAGSGTPTITTCGTPAGYTAAGPDASGCFTYTPTASVSLTTPATSCIVICKNGVCDTTYITIPVPVTPDTIVTPPAKCPTCPVGPVCVVGNDIPAGAGTPTITTCGTPAGYTAAGPDASGCFTYTPTASVSLTTPATSCIVICNNGVCDTTYITIPVPVTPDTVVTAPAACPTCPVGPVCVVGDDIAVHAGATYTTCGTPAGYTAAGPDASGCFTYTPTSTVSLTTPATSCIVICKNGVCDTTYITIPVPITPDTVTVRPTCPTCPVKACVVADDITVNSTTTYSSCGLSASQAGKGTLVLDLNGCLIFQGNGLQGALDTIKTCVVACNGNICDTTYINIAPAVKPFGPDTINVTPACGTCTIAPICATGDDLPASTGTPTVTTCGLTTAQSALGTLTLNSSNCAVWTPNGTLQTDTIKTCIIKCVTSTLGGLPVCDTTKIWIAPPPTPDYDTVTPACPTCPVKVCPVADDIVVTSATTFRTCGAPSGYTITGGPSTAGCYTFTPLSPMPTTSVTTCVVACNGTVCDTTYVVINPPVSPDSVITTPACPTCPVKVCTIGDDIANHTGATYSSCGAPIGYNQTGPDANGCYTYTPTSPITTTTVTTCQVICKNGICDTTYVVINPPAPEKNNDVNITDVNTLVNGNVHTNDIVPAGTTYGPPTPNPSNPAGGVLNFSPDGSYTFIAPTPGVYKFIVPVCVPGQSLPCPTTELDITVLDPNTTSNPPVANTDLGTTKGTNPVTINSLANDLSGNLGGTLDPTSVVVTTPPAHGTYSVNPTTGAITYTPTAGFTGKDTLYYSVKDANGNTSIAMQVITVLPIDAGNTTTATDDYASAGKGQNATGNVKINDIDPEGNTTSVTPLDSTIAGVGRFVIDASGNYTFTPAPGYTGPISVPYTITDANGAKASATVHILISNLVAPLNVNWLGFNITNTHCLANLVWQVSSLANTSYFEIQKSSNSANWKTIGKVTDIDRTKLEAQFTFTDNELLKETNSYYRLKEIELNGNTNYSEVRYANCKEGYSINIYPNPVEDKLTINFTRESDLEPTIMIYNMAGQRVQTNLIKNTNNKELVFSLSHLASGVYTIIINDNDFGKSTYKVMKK